MNVRERKKNSQFISYDCYRKLFLVIKLKYQHRLQVKQIVS